MKKRDTNIKEIIIIILILLFGAGLTAASFCVYYLVKPQNNAVLAVLCVVDYLYNLFSACMLFKFLDAEKILLKGFLLSVGYIAAFIGIAALFILFNGQLELLKNIILAIVFYAFFTGPCIIIILAVVALVLCLLG